MNLKIGIIGCGKQAEKHIKGFVSLGVLPKNIFVCDTQVEFAKNISGQFGVQYVEKTEGIFENENIQCIDICTPTPSHFELITNAISRGKHFFCEKPLTDNLEQAVKIESLLHSSNCIGMVGYIYKFAPAFEELKKILDSKSPIMGDLTTAFFRIGGRGSHKSWKHLSQYGGGAINEMLVHMLELILWYFGEIQTVEVISCDQKLSSRVIEGQEINVNTEDYILLKLLTEGGLEVFCQADMITPAFTQFVEVQGSNGSYFGSIQPSFDSYLHLVSAAGDYDVGRNNVDTQASDLYFNQLGYLLECIKLKRLPARSTVSQSVQLMKVIKNIKTLSDK